MAQQSLFGNHASSNVCRRIDLPDAELCLYEGAFGGSEANHYLDVLRADTPWRRDQILIHGKRIPLPRLQAWYADDAIPLSYSGMEIPALAMTSYIDAIRGRVHSLCGLEFNGVLLTLYRDGNDSVGWHSDDEPEFGPDPVIASVSFGRTRDFVLKHRSRRDLSPVVCELPHGSLLVMGRGSQTHWAHRVPKRKAVTEARINLTLRNVVTV